MRVVLYTAIIGNYDTLKNHIDIDWIDDYVCLTDSDMKSDTNRKVMKIEPKHENPVKSARYCKTHPYEYFPDADIAIRVDGQSQITRKDLFKKLLEAYREDTDIMLFRHPRRNCIYDEAEEIVKQQKEYWRFKWVNTKKQISEYRYEWFPKHYWLSATGLLMTMNTPRTIEMLDRWQEEIEKRTERDQLSFWYVMRKYWYNKQRDNFKRLIARE